MGGDFDADTQQAVTQYFFTMPAENLDVALRIEAIRMKAICCRRKALGQRSAAPSNRRSPRICRTPNTSSTCNCSQAMFQGTPYAHDALGTRPSFDKTTDADAEEVSQHLVRAEQRHPRDRRQRGPAGRLGQVKEIFGGIPSGALPARPEYDFQPVKPQTLKLDTDLPYGMTAVTFRFPGSDSPDFAAAQILSDVLSSQRGKLYELVPRRQGAVRPVRVRQPAQGRHGLRRGRIPRRGGRRPTCWTRSNKSSPPKSPTASLADLVEAAKRREIVSAELQKNSVVRPGHRMVPGRRRRRPQVAR